VPDQPLNVLRSAELKRRGIAAVEEALRAGPVHLLKRNSPAAVVLSEADYNRLRRLADRPVTAGSSCLEWLLDLPPASQGRSKAEIDAELHQERDW
jgi:hypothetical protein